MAILTSVCGVRAVAGTVMQSEAQTRVIVPGLASRVYRAAHEGIVILPCGDPLAPVDKYHRLPADCIPANLVALPHAYAYGETQLLVAGAAQALMEMIDDARREGLDLYAISSYRSYQRQQEVFSYWVSVLGYEAATRVSAEPGHSEHQLGTTTDVVSPSSGYQLSNFASTAEAAWVAQHSWRYGFIVSYPEGQEHITGYAHEPWHIRYVGRDVAAAVRQSGLTPGEYLHAMW